MSDYGLGRDMASLLSKIEALETKLDDVMDEVAMQPIQTVETNLFEDAIQTGSVRQLRFNLGNMDAGPGCVRDVIAYYKDDGNWVISGRGGNGSRHSTSYVRLQIGITKYGRTVVKSPTAIRLREVQGN